MEVDPTRKFCDDCRVKRSRKAAKRNKKLGGFKDNIDLLHKAIEYLDRFNEFRRR